jgi:levansucrase
MKKNRQSLRKFLAYILLGTTLTLGCQPQITAQNLRTEQVPISDASEKTSVWTWEDATKIQLNDTNVAPKIEEFVNLAEDANVWVWDSWVLRNRDTSLAQVNGYYALFSLIAPRSLAPEERHSNARIGYWYSQDGRNWTFAGRVFPEEDSLGSRQWSGGALYDKGNLYLFYTAVGRKGEPEVRFEQRIAVAKAKIVTNAEGMSFTNWTPHQIIVEPEGVHYQTEIQSNYTPEGIVEPEPGPSSDPADGSHNIIYSFRDPWFFEDPVDGKSYLLFAASTPGTTQEKTCTIDEIGNVPNSDNIKPGVADYSGSVGVAVAPDPDNLFVWKRLPSIFSAECVNQQLELPRFVFKDGKYYLFIASHNFTFPKDLRNTGLDALYGFVSDSLNGKYTPLNESGLVLGNPEDNPIQTFAWVVLPNEVVLSFMNYTNLGEVSPERLSQQSIEFQRDRFGGTLAPTIQIEISGVKTKVIRELGQAEIIPE